MILAFLSILLFLALITLNDIQTIKTYQHVANQKMRKRKMFRHPMPPLPHVYPWWHSGFPHGGFRVGPWTWSRKQHFFHPLIGWY